MGAAAFQLMSLDACGCEVLETEKLQVDGSKDYTVYRVQVQRRQTAITPGNPEHYVVTKRFSEFKALRENLFEAGAEPLRKVPFPKRKIKNSSKTVEKRVEALRAWMNLVIAVYGDEDYAAPTLTAFLTPQPQGWVPGAAGADSDDDDDEPSPASSPMAGGRPQRPMDSLAGGKLRTGLFGKKKRRSAADAAASGSGGADGPESFPVNLVCGVWEATGTNAFTGQPETERFEMIRAESGLTGSSIGQVAGSEFLLDKIELTADGVAVGGLCLAFDQVYSDGQRTRWQARLAGSRCDRLEAGTWISLPPAPTAGKLVGTFTATLVEPAAPHPGPATLLQPAGLPSLAPGSGVRPGLRLAICCPEGALVRTEARKDSPIVESLQEGTLPPSAVVRFLRSAVVNPAVPSPDGSPGPGQLRLQVEWDASPLDPAATAGDGWISAFKLDGSQLIAPAPDPPAGGGGPAEATPPAAAQQLAVVQVPAGSPPPAPAGLQAPLSPQQVQELLAENQRLKQLLAGVAPPPAPTPAAPAPAAPAPAPNHAACTTTALSASVEVELPAGELPVIGLQGLAVASLVELEVAVRAAVTTQLSAAGRTELLPLGDDACRLAAWDPDFEDWFTPVELADLSGDPCRLKLRLRS